MTEAAQTKLSRPGGRSERIRKAVAQAVLQLISEQGIHFEIQEVSRLSGVGRATVSRRWPDRAALFGEALSEHVSRFHIPLEGVWPDDLLRVARAFRTFMNDPIELALNRALLISYDETYHNQMYAYWGPHIELIKKPIYQAIERGDIDPAVDVEILIAALSDLLVMESMVGNFGNQDITERLVMQLIRGCPPPKK